MSDAPPLIVSGEGPPVTPAQQPKKKMSGCLLAFLILLGIGVLFAVIGGLLVARALRTPEGQALADMVKSAAEGAVGPGVDALKAQGCSGGLAIDLDKLGEAAKRLNGGKPIEVGGPHGLTVTCLQPQRPVECGALARAYAAAVGRTEPLSMIASNGDVEVCSGLFSVDGTKIGVAIPVPGR